MIQTKKLLVYMKGHRLECVLAPLFKMLEATFELIVPLIVADIIDRGIPGGDKGIITKSCLILVLLAAVGLAASVTAQYFSAAASTGFAAKVRHKLMESILSMSYTELDGAGTATLITRMTGDVEQVQSGVNLTLRLLLRSPFVVFGAMIMAFTVDTRSALIFTVLIPVLCVIVFGIMLATMPMYKKVQSTLDHVSASVRSNIGGRRVIRAFCREDEESKNFSSVNDSLTKIQRLAGGVSALMNPVTLVCVNIAVIVLLRRGGVRVDNGILTQGQVVALYNYMSQILVELIKMANLIISVTKAAACGSRISAVIENTHGLPHTDGKAYHDGDDNYAVEFCGVSFRYKNAGEDSLSHIDLKVKKGETVGVIGGTGAGKSTFASLIPRFYDVTEGSVFVDGIDVRNYDVDTLRKKIGIVPQHAALFSGTIKDNILVGKPDATDEEIKKALESAQAKDVVDSKAEGLDFVIGEDGSGLSGGQKQRLTIARALVRDPEILILDDSASALDYATDLRLRRALSELDGGMTVFIISQRVKAVRDADRVIVLDDGKIVDIGRHGDLLDRCPLYREICDSQSENEEALA